MGCSAAPWQPSQPRDPRHAGLIICHGGTPALAVPVARQEAAPAPFFPSTTLGERAHPAHGRVMGEPRHRARVDPSAAEQHPPPPVNREEGVLPGTSASLKGSPCLPGGARRATAWRRYCLLCSPRGPPAPPHSRLASLIAHVALLLPPGVDWCSHGVLWVVCACAWGALRACWRPLAGRLVRGAHALISGISGAASRVRRRSPAL